MNKYGAMILVVDEERETVYVLQNSLTAHGYKVLTSKSGEEAIKVILQQHPDLLLLDLLLTGMSGLEVCRQVREISNLPIIALSIKDTERDKVEALDLGADDYVTKPFGINEVLARIRVILRRVVQPPKGATPCFQVGPLFVDFARRGVSLAGKEIALTPTEYALLKAFITYRGRILTRQYLIKEVWGAYGHDRTHSLHVYVGQLRQKIEPVPEHPGFIFNIPGVGYRFTDETEQ
jgi:two-component system, OmpR family, KDP operon response regulator KdpE